MWRRSAEVTWQRAAIGDILEAIASAAPLNEILDGAELRLYTNAFLPNADMVPADFTDATFVGYALITPLVWSVPGNTGTGRLVHVEGNFVAGAIAPGGETVMGYVVTTAAKAAVLFAEQFADPVNIVSNGDFLSLDVVLELPFSWPVSG